MKFKSWNVEMFGLVVLFCLFIWLLLTLLAMHIGKRIAMRFGKSKNAGRFWGFMFAMGWVYCIFAFEFVKTAIVARHYCQKAGIFTYVSPEEWKAIPRISDIENKKAPDAIMFKGIKYENPYPVGEQGIVGYSIRFQPDPYVDVLDVIYYDPLIEKVIVHVNSVYASVNQNPPFGYVNFFQSLAVYFFPRCEYLQSLRLAEIEHEII